MTSGATLRRPIIVLRTIGGNEYSTLAIKPTTVPKPNSNKMGSKYANAGTVWNRSSAGMIARSARSE